jgi:ribosomal protein S18 acetylase RimI-like enzyme
MVCEPLAAVSPGDVAAIRALAATVERHDGLALKRNWDQVADRDPDESPAFVARVAGHLVGFAVLDGLAGEYELLGMVHPDHRRRGIGQALFDLAVGACRERGARRLLLVCEHASTSGQAFVAAQGTRLRYDFSEYRLELDAAGTRMPTPRERPVRLRQATAADIPAVVTIRAAAFGDAPDVARASVEHAFAEAGSRIFVAEVDGEPVGTIGVVPDEPGMYLRALAVRPERQRRGYGRAILADAIALMRAEGHARLALEVATENRGALSLYQSSGFVETNRFDYYSVDLSPRRAATA